MIKNIFSAGLPVDEQLLIQKNSIRGNNDGKRLGKDNYNVNWLDDHANIIIHAEEMEDISLDLFYRQGE